MKASMISGTIATAVGLAIGIPLGVGTASTSGSSAIRIDTISSRFALDRFNFEVNPETGSAAIRLDYSYPPYRMFGDETYRDPGERIATVPGLSYDRAAHAVVYQSGATKTACAVEASHRVLRQRPRLKNTGACVVTARVTGSETLDTYFEVRGR